ncbi:M61 family metallopeptidase [Rhizorhapis suberifaciens]|uniref:Putative metalloprotease with PDZ domain n=1 Tax=Rhizorhapis suberifaciens TaxID=13656 RepID=A0A840HRV2_9SPHN|nr:M61 family metallopeptidase [Rhizorhapis suberifaciens]MBB4640633.1 putative metalloprotease with PDZ domain [Rhizorhapis suberifaciens]
MRLAPIVVIAALLITPASAQNSKPAAAQPIANDIPAAQDVAYPGTMRLMVDATDINQNIFRVRQVIPVAAGPMVLLYPEWLPGNHGPRGPIDKLVGLKISAGGKTVPWVRDPVDVYAFHIDVPQGSKELNLEFQFVSATEDDQGRIVVTPNMLNLQWSSVSLYPAGYYVRNIPVQASVTYPAGWQAATALRPTSMSGNTVTYETSDYDTLVDSPVFAGRYFKSVALSPKVRLNMVADEAADLAYTPAQMALHQRLVEEARALFGTEHYDHYDFLLALSESLGGIGLEHHRSSENSVDREYFSGWDKGPGRRNLLPHELVHSWNGKYRRPQGIWTPDFRTPMQDNLLWVYEGQTQFWGYVLGARSGLYSKDQTLDALAAITAGLDQRVGRSWRPLEDTTHDPIIAARRPKPWTSWQRSEDYYNEGLLIWLEVDGLLRELTRGRRSMDDFAKAFFGGREGDWGVSAYNLNDVVTALNGLAPYDWDGFLHQRVNQTNAEAPKGGLAKGGYRLVYTEQPNSTVAHSEERTGAADLIYGPGIILSKSGKVTAVIWDSPAFDAGLAVGMNVVAVNGTAYSAERMKKAISENKGRKSPIVLLVRSGDKYRNIELDYSGGLVYPHLQKIERSRPGEGESGIDLLLKAAS